MSKPMTNDIPELEIDIEEDDSADEKELATTMSFEGDESEVIRYGVYRCVFRAFDDSLYVMIKNHQSKRTFSNVFRKRTLLDMDLKQPVGVIVNLLKTAQTGLDENLKFEIGFSTAEGTKKESPGKKMRDAFRKGDALYVCIAIQQSWFTADYSFKLVEQNRSETDIIRDIIADMREDMANSNGVAVYKRSTTPDTNLIVLDVTAMAPTIEGMAKLSDDKKYIVAGMAGVYKVTGTMNWNEYNIGCATDFLSIQLNGEDEAKKFAGGTEGVGTVKATLLLKEGDRISFYVNCLHATAPQFNAFTICKL